MYLKWAMDTVNLLKLLFFELLMTKDMLILTYASLLFSARFYDANNYNKIWGCYIPGLWWRGFLRLVLFMYNCYKVITNLINFLSKF